MTAKEVLATLRKLGKPQTAAIYKRFESGDDVFGTLTSEISKLRKKIGVNRDLSKELWQTGNAEARILALLVADPARVTRADADAWLADGPVRFLGCYLADLVARTPVAEATMREWMKSRDEHTREMGYGILSSRLRADPGSLSDAEAERALATIEKEIHRSPNWARYAMNAAVIAIGTSKPALRERAIETARRIGKVDVDHGETCCKTPDALVALTRDSRRKRCP